MAVIKKIKKTINSIKLCAVFTAICFMISTLGANLYAIPMSENPSKKYEDVFNKTSVISGEYGKITSFKDAKSDTTVINIQDLHCHPQTQKNISKIIEQIKDKYNLTSIYVEGGYGDINTGWLDEIKDKQIKKQVINKLLEEGILTGSEYFMLSSGTKNVDFKGIDEESLHKDNVKRLSRIISNQPKYDEVIKKVSKEINILEKMYINKRNVRFNENIENYLAGKIDVKRFYRQLIKYVNDINKNPQKYNNITSVKLEDYPNIVGYMSLKKTSQELDINKVTQELKEVITVLKNKIPYNVYSRLLKDTDNFNDSQKTVELLTLLCDRENINLDNYSQLNHFFKMNDLGAKINTVKLVFEERQLIEQIKMALSYNMQEYEITYISDFEKYFKDYLQYKLTETDWTYFKQGFKKFIDIYEKYASVNRIKEIENDFEDLNKYYEINDNRNNIFVNRVLDGTNTQHISNSNRYEQEILKDSKQIIIAVTGGFHSEALEELLTKKGVNTLVVTPSIYDSTEQANKTYCDIIEQQSKINSQALAYTLASCSGGKYQKELLLNALVDILGRDNIVDIKAVFADADLSEIQKYSQLQDVSDQQRDKVVSVLKAAVDEIFDDVSDMRNTVLPSRQAIDNAMLKVVKVLVEDMGLYFADGTIFEIENSQFNGKDLKGIPAEIYSRMMPSLQKALLNFEMLKNGIAESKSKSVSSQKQKGKKKNTQEKEQSVTEDMQTESKTFDIRSVSSERKEVLLNRFYEKNPNALDKLFEIAQKHNFDISEDSTLLEILISKINANIYWNTDLDGIIERMFNVYNTGKVDTALKYSCLEKYIDTFDKDEYMALFDTLFSLDEKVIEYFYSNINETYDAETLLTFYEIAQINEYFSTLFEKFGEEISKLTDTSKLEYLFDNFNKIKDLSKSDFSSLISLIDKDLFAIVLNTSENLQQIITRLNFIREYNINFLILKDKPISDIIKNLTKFDGLAQSDFISLIKLNAKAITFILNNVENSSDITKIFELCKKYRVFYDYNDDENVKDFVDIRFKAIVKYANTVNDSFFDELFDTNTKELKIIVNSIDDGNFVKDFIFNPQYKSTYFELIEKLAELEIKNIASENNQLALKLVIDEKFNDILTKSGLDNVSDKDNIVARYHAAIAVSRFIFDSIGNEVVDYDLNSKSFRNIINKSVNTYIKYVKAMKKVSLIDKNTEVIALLNNETYDGTKPRFNIDAMKDILSYIKEHKGIRNFERAQDARAASKWLNAIRMFGINDRIGDQKAYFFFRGHGGKDSLEIVSPKRDKIFRGREISRDESVNAEVIPVEQMAEALIYAATRKKNPLDLRNVTIDLSCCNSYYFARKLYSLLKKEGITTFPTILTAAGLETELGYTIDNNIGNLHKGLLDAMSVSGTEKASLPAITLDFVSSMEYQITQSNITMFTSFYDQDILDTIKESRKEIADLYSASKESSDKKENKEDSVLKNKNLQQVDALPQDTVEASIFSVLKDRNPIFNFLDSKAHIWEELVFRTVPSIIAMINPMIGIPLFLVMQPLFIFSHSIVKWLVQKDSAGEDALSLKEIAKKDFKNLLLPTVAMSLPYIISFTLPLFTPAVTALSTKIISLTTATAVTQFAHYEYNKNQKDSSKRLSVLSFKSIYNKIRLINRHIETLKRELALADESVYENVKNFNKNDENFHKEFTPRRDQSIAFAKQIEEKLKEKGIVIENLSEKIEQNIDGLNKFSVLLTEMYEILTNIKFLEQEANTIYLQRLIVGLKENFISLLENEFCETLINVYDDKTFTKKHVQNVYKFSRMISEHTGFSDDLDFKFMVVIAAALHDIGKNVIPEEILNKPSRLTDEEYEIVKMHTLFGGLIMDGSIFESFSAGAKDHHKNKHYGYDTEILRLLPEIRLPIETEADPILGLITDIINIADVYDALISERQYKKAMSHEKAFKEIVGYSPQEIAEQITDVIDDEKTGYNKEALIYFIDWYFGELTYEELRSQMFMPSEEGLQGPVLTMAWLKNILDFFPIRQDTKLKIVSIVEAPIIMLGLLFPSVNDFFLDQHKVSETNRQKLERRLEFLDKSIKNKFVSAYKLVKEKIKIAVISPVVAFCFALIKAFDINKNLHYYFNKFVYDSTYDNDDKAGIIKLIEKNKKKIIDAQNSYAHLYEELLFRTVPAIVAMINPMIGIPLFLVMQPLFIFAHSIVKWVIDILPNDKDVTLKETVKNDFRSLSLPTAALVLPFIISLALPIVTPAANLLSAKALSLSASTALSQFIHYEYNKNTAIELQLKVHKKNKKSKKNKITENNVSSFNDNDIRQPQGYTIRDIIDNIIKLAKSKTSSYKDLELTQKQIKDLLLRSGVSQKEIDEIDFTQGYLPENIVSLLKSKNTQIVGTTIDPKKTLIENLKQSPILFSLAIETFLRAYESNFNENSTLGDLLTFIDERYSRKLYEATCTDLRGYFGEIYVVNTLISGIIPDKRAGPIIIRPEMPSDNNARGFDIYDINRTKIQVKTGGKEIVSRHFIKYWRSITANSGQGIIAIPVLTTKNIKNNNFYRDDRVQGIDVTTETVTKFAHEIVSALHKIGYKKSMRGARDLKLTDLINSFKGFPTEDAITTDELIDLLTSNNQMVAFERHKKDAEQENLQQETETQQNPQIIEFEPNVISIEYLVGENVVVRTESGRVRVIYVDKRTVSMNEKWRGVLGKGELGSYGIEDIVYDDNGNIVEIKFEEGAEVSCIKTDKEPIGVKENNLGFSREELEKLYFDTQTDDYIDVYLDDDVDVISKNIENAAMTNKLIVVHMFKEGFKTSDLTLSQIFEKYRQAYGLISNRFKLSDIFDSLTEDSKYTDFTLDFFFQEMLKNALVHGNVGKFEAPIALYIKLDENKDKIQTFSIYNRVSNERASQQTEVLTTSAHLTGDHMGNEIMEHNPLRTLSVGEQKIDGMKFWRARAVLRDSIDMQNVQWEQDYKNPKAKTQQEMLEEFWSVLPENVGMVNEELQKGKTVLQTAIAVALAETDDSLSPDFEQRHTTLEGKYGAKQIRNFLEKYLPVADKVSKVSVRLGNLVRKIVIGASVIKHVIIDYRYIKASGLQEAINMFGNNTYIDENGQIHIPPVLISQDIEELAQEYELRNTGIKVNGNSIYQIGTDGILVYGAKDVSLQKISKVINESAQIKSEIEKMLSKQGADNITIEVDGVVYGQQEGISFEDGITIIGMQELKGKSSEYVNGYVTSALEIKRSMAISYGQKMIISLESINEKEKLYKALTEGKTRKIISEQQYRDLDLSEQEILNLRQQGIEIYVDTDKEADEYKQNGLSGRIERKDGKIYIKDFYSQDEIEVEQIGEDESLSAIESKIITSDKPVMIDIKILANKFNQERDITDKYGALGAMVGGFISNIKVKVGIGEITKQDIENIGYNLDYNKIPVISNNINKEEFLNATSEQVIEMLSIQDNSEIGIMIKGIKKQDIRDKFVDVIKARVMAKTALTEKYKEFGLKDKKLEKLLGEMLKKQVLNKDKNTVNIENGFTGTKEEVIRKIMQESQKAYNNDEVAINTIIEIILVYGEEYKQKQVSRVLDANDMRTYRSMLAAA